MMERKINTAVITGPTGAVGVALCSAALARGWTVYAVCRPASPRVTALPKHDRLHLVRCDLHQLQLLPAQLQGVKADAWFHLGWAHTIGAGRNDMPAQIQNIQSTIEAVRAASALGCHVFVGAGSQAEYGRAEGMLCPHTPAFPENGYGMAKLCAGQMSRAECAALGIEHIWARILSVYGPYDGPHTMISSVAHALMAGERPALTAGEQQWDYLYSADAAQALCDMAQRGKNGATYPLGSGVTYPLRRYVEELRDAIDPALPLGFGELPYTAGQVMCLQADLSTLTQDTGFVPRVAFAQGIRQTIAWMRSGR